MIELTDVQDRNLAEQAAAGSDEAFTVLVGRHRETLVRFVARRTGRATIAEDAVQEAMLSAHRALRDGAPPRDVKAWLHTIAWRRAVDMLRREVPAAPGDEWQDLRSVGGLDEVVADAWEFECMLRHWAGLPHRQRHALAMSVLEGRSLEEIGDVFGVSPDAAKSLVARSRRSLAHAVASDEPREPVGLRRRAMLLFPSTLVERLRDLMMFTTHHEAPASLITKACAGACAAVLAGGSSAAVVAVAPVEPLVVATAERPAKAKEKKKPRRHKPVRAAAVTASTAPSASASTPAAGSTAGASAGTPGRQAPPAGRGGTGGSTAGNPSLAGGGATGGGSTRGGPPGGGSTGGGSTAGGSTGGGGSPATPTPPPAPTPAPTTQPAPEPVASAEPVQ